MRRLILSLMVVAAPAMAQSTLVAGARANFTEGHNYIARAAEQLPESLYAWRPIAGVRSFAEQFGHVAGSEVSTCATVLGDAAKEENAIEKTAKTKAALIAALQESARYCERAYALTDAQAAQPIKLYGRDRSKMYALVENATHDWEHYGNLVTYLRLKGLIPPSSQ